MLNHYKYMFLSKLLFLTGAFITCVLIYKSSLYSKNSNSLSCKLNLTFSQCITQTQGQRRVNTNWINEKLIYGTYEPLSELWSTMKPELRELLQNRLSWLLLFLGKLI